MPKTSNENILPEVNIECEDSTRAKTQQESEADGCPDLCLEVEEELQESEHSEDESTEEDWESFDEHSRVTKGVQYWPVRLSKVVGDVSDWTPNCDAGNESMQNDQLPSMESQTEGGSNAEFEPFINIKMEVDSPHIESHKIADTEEHESVYARERMLTNTELFVPEGVKQDVKKEPEDEVYDDHYIAQDSSQLHEFADYQLGGESAIDHKTLNSHKDLYPVCLTRAANAPSEEFSAHGKNRKSLMAGTSASEKVECCLVCNVPCVITENRKIPSLPFCRKCKKAYFYQLSHRYTSDNVYRNKECTAGGFCRIDYRQKWNCPKCHHKKFLAALKEAERLFKQPFKLSKSSSCKIQKVPNDQEQGLSTIRDEMLIQEALTCQPVVSMERLDTDTMLAQEYSRFQDNLDLIKQELSNVFDDNEQINNSCLQPMNEAIAGNSNYCLQPKNEAIAGNSNISLQRKNEAIAENGNICLQPKNEAIAENSNICLQPKNEAIAENGSSWLMEDTIPSTFVNDSSFMVIRPENHFESLSGSRKENELLNNSVGRKRGRPRKKPHGDIECKTSAPRKRGRPRTKHLDGDRAVNDNETSNEASNISPVNHPTNPWSSDNLLGSCSTQNESRNVSVDSEFQPRGIDRLIGDSAGKLVACGSQAPNFVNVWSNRTSVEQPIKRGRGRPTLKSKSLERRANEPITVSILNCGHACSKCNSAQTTKWLEEHDYAANPPLSFSINDDQRQFEEESSSNSALVFQKLCEINQLLNGKSQFHFDPKTGVLKFKTEALSEQTGANLTPFSQILQGVNDTPTQQPPVSLAAPAQPSIFVIPPLQPTVMPFSSAQTFLIPCSSQSIDLPLDNFIVSNTHLEVIP